jgi:hypothetical protein
MKLKKVDLKNLILKYDVIHDKLGVICNTNLKRPRNFGDIGSLGDMGTRRKLPENPENT